MQKVKTMSILTWMSTQHLSRTCKITQVDLLSSSFGPTIVSSSTLSGLHLTALGEL